jgi:hypothetical protein
VVCQEEAALAGLRILQGGKERLQLLDYFEGVCHTTGAVCATLKRTV